MFPHLPAPIDNYSIFFHKLDLMGVQEVRWDKRGTVRAGDYTFFSMEKRMRIIYWEKDFFVQQRMVPAGKRVQVFSSRMSFIPQDRDR